MIVELTPKEIAVAERLIRTALTGWDPQGLPERSSYAAAQRVQAKLEELLPSNNNAEEVT